MLSINVLLHVLFVSAHITNSDCSIPGQSTKQLNPDHTSKCPTIVENTNHAKSDFDNVSHDNNGDSCSFMKSNKHSLFNSNCSGLNDTAQSNSSKQVLVVDNDVDDQGSNVLKNDESNTLNYVCGYGNSSKEGNAEEDAHQHNVESGTDRARRNGADRVKGSGEEKRNGGNGSRELSRKADQITAKESLGFVESFEAQNMHSSIVGCDLVPGHKSGSRQDGRMKTKKTTLVNGENSIVSGNSAVGFGLGAELLVAKHADKDANKQKDGGRKANNKNDGPTNLPWSLNVAGDQQPTARKSSNRNKNIDSGIRSGQKSSDLLNSNESGKIEINEDDFGDGIIGMKSANATKPVAKSEMSADGVNASGNATEAPWEKRRRSRFEKRLKLDIKDYGQQPAFKTHIYPHYLANVLLPFEEPMEFSDELLVEASIEIDLWYVYDDRGSLRTIIRQDAAKGERYGCIYACGADLKWYKFKDPPEKFKDYCSSLPDGLREEEQLKEENGVWCVWSSELRKYDKIVYRGDDVYTRCGIQYTCYTDSERWVTFKYGPYEFKKFLSRLPVVISPPTITTESYD